jgi:signal transduction histidine kinase
MFQTKQNKYDYRQIFLDFNRSVHSIKDKASLISSILTRIYELIPAKTGYLFWEGNDAHYNLMNVSGKKHDLYLLADDGLIQWLRLNEKPLTVSLAPEYANIFSDNDLKTIQQLDTVLVCPLKANNRLRGVIFLGSREDGEAYHPLDLEILTVMLDNAALAIENVTYQEERIAHLKHIFQTDRLAVIGQLAAGAAHEIRNPLTSIKSAIQYVQGDIREPKKQDIIKSVLLEVDRINDILAGLLSFSKQNQPVKREFDLALLIDQTLGLIKTTRIKKQIAFIVTSFAPSIPVIADRDQLKQVLMNILLNAIDAIDEEGTVRIDTQQSGIEEKIYYTLTVTDNGKGIAAENIEKIFDPFYTTKEEGTGLGLSISYGIIHQHKGNIVINNDPSGGVQVIVRLPKEIYE